MSKRYKTVKEYYDLGVWSAAKVRNAVLRGWITEAEYTQITGEAY